MQLFPRPTPSQLLPQLLSVCVGSYLSGLFIYVVDFVTRTLGAAPGVLG